MIPHDPNRRAPHAGPGAGALGARHLVIVCGRSGGMDERVSQIAVVRGDPRSAITCSGGGEPAAIGAGDRAIAAGAGVVGRSTIEDSFEAGLRYPQSTRGPSFTWLNAGHSLWTPRRREPLAPREALRRTRERRPELLDKETRRTSGARIEEGHERVEVSAGDGARSPISGGGDLVRMHVKITSKGEGADPGLHEA